MQFSDSLAWSKGKFRPSREIDRIYPLRAIQYKYYFLQSNFCCILFGWQGVQGKTMQYVFVCVQLVKNRFIGFGNQSTKPKDRADVHLRKLRSVTWTSLGQEDPLEEEMAISLFSSLENPMVRGDWQAIVRRVTMSETRLSTRTHTTHSDTHTHGYMLNRWLLLSLYREISILLHC